LNQNNRELFRDIQFSILRCERLRDAIQKIPSKIQRPFRRNSVTLQRFKQCLNQFLCKNLLPTSTMQIGPSKSKAQIQSNKKSGPNQSRVEKKRSRETNHFCQIYSNQNTQKVPTAINIKSKQLRERLMRRPVLPMQS